MFAESDLLPADDHPAPDNVKRYQDSSCGIQPPDLAIVGSNSSTDNGCDVGHDVIQVVLQGHPGTISQNMICDSA